LNKQTTFYLKLRRYKCLSCGKTVVENQQLVPKRGKTSFQTIFNILNMAKSYSATWKSISKVNHISDTAAIDIFDRYINLERLKLPRVLCIDECYNKHQFSKPYTCILFDFLSRKMVDAFEDRSKYNLISYFTKLTVEERNNVEYVIIDMWEPYLDVCKTIFPNAVVAIDSFHVIKEIGDALSKTRKRIMGTFSRNSEEYYLLKKWNHLLFNTFLPSDEKHKIKGLGNKYYNRYGIQKRIYNIHPDLKVASEFYLSYRHKNEHCSKEIFDESFENIVNNKEIINVAEFPQIISMLINWKSWILNSFIKVESRRLSNGPIEGFNSNFKKLLTVANGLESFHRFRNRLMYIFNDVTCISPTKERINCVKRKQRGKYNKKSAV